MRLNSVLVTAGLATSRRAADQLIAAGKVRLNDRVVTDFSIQPTAGDKLSVDKRTVIFQNIKQIVIALNKPVGYVCSHSAQSGQKTIFSLLPQHYAQFKLAGRLDIDSEGLVILSNDGTFIQQLTHPSGNHGKTYQVTVRETLTNQTTEHLRQPQLILGQKIQALSVKQTSPHDLEITVSEGLNRQIRRLCGAVGLTVMRLRRLNIGPYQLGDLTPGQWRIESSR